MKFCDDDNEENKLQAIASDADDDRKRINFRRECHKNIVQFLEDWLECKGLIVLPRE